MKFVYSEKYIVDFGIHVFPTEKYVLIKDRLLNEDIAEEKDFIEPSMPREQDLLVLLDKEYMNDLKNLRWTSRTMFSELPLTREIVDMYMLAAEGTFISSSVALEEKVVYHIGGGFHHAFKDKAEGFCYINDIAYAILRLKKENRIRRAVVIDCDLHQGNGTARIFRDDSDVFTFSIHQQNLYPVKEKSDLDIGLPDFADDELYLEKLDYALSVIENNMPFDLCVYQAGADPYKDDKLGNLMLSKEGLLERDSKVAEFCKKNSVPVSITLGGGYSRELDDLVDIHFNTAKIFYKTFRRKDENSYIKERNSI